MHYIISAINQLRSSQWAVLLLLFSVEIQAYQVRDVNTETLILGVDRDSVYGPLLTNKNVALMVNQSSINHMGTHTVDKLLAEQSKYNFTISKLFSVEHGIRGQAESGLGDDDHIDPQTGLPVISLYGRDANGRSRVHPTPEQLQDVDIVIYDLQDVGVRYFTYTIAMHHVLESLQREQKSLMVFDRPNPLGVYVYGPILQQENLSAIGQHPIPMVHGLTSGELANMIVNEGWLTNFADRSWQAFTQTQYQLPPQHLHIITMQNYTHALPYSLPVAPSPNLPTDLAIQRYPSLALFEATSVNTGRGTTAPFAQLGFADEQFYCNTCYSVDHSIAQAGWPQAGKQVCGDNMTEQSVTTIVPTIAYFVDWWFRFKQYDYQLAVNWQDEAHYLDYQDSYFVIRPFWLAKLIGTRQFLQQLNLATDLGLTKQQTIDMIEASWQPELDAYQLLREQYRLYP